MCASIQPTLDHDEKVADSIQKMKVASELSKRYYGKPLLICYSGGKDSDAILKLAEISGIDYEVSHSLTTADAPETVMHVKKTFRRLEDSGIHCEIKYPYYKGQRVTMWSLIPQKKMPPTRTVRYCCSILKETGGKGRAIATGVRKSESKARSTRKFANNFSTARPGAIDFDDAASLFEDPDQFAAHDDNFLRSCRIKGKTSFQPILEWESGDVLQFCHEHGARLNPLYSEGFRRVGCIGCPFAGKSEREREFDRWPKYKDMYMRAFKKMLDERVYSRMECAWTTADEVFDWWING